MVFSIVVFVQRSSQAEVGQVHMLSKEEGVEEKYGIISPSAWIHPFNIGAVGGVILRTPV